MGQHIQHRSPIVDFPTKTGTGRIFMNGEVQSVSWRPSPHDDYMTQIVFQDGSEIEVSDYEDRFDYIYNPSDDGKTFYHTFVLLDPNEPDPIDIPTDEELRKTAGIALTPMLEHVVQGEIDSDDLAFACNLFSISACLLRRIQQTGSVDAARRNVLQKTWHI